jgi:hemerythrin
MSEQKKKTYECQYCQKIFKRKSFFERHFEKCEDKEMEIFNYEGLIEHWKDIDPIIAHCFEVELEKLLEK